MKGGGGDGNRASGTKADYKSQKLRPCLLVTVSFIHFVCSLNIIIDIVGTKYRLGPLS